MTEKDTSRQGPVANIVFAALWLGLLVWHLATPGPPLIEWPLAAAYVALITYFVVRGVRLLRARSREP